MPRHMKGGDIILIERFGRLYRFEVLRVWEGFFTLAATGGTFAVKRAFWNVKASEWRYERAGYPSNQRKIDRRALGLEPDGR